MREILTPTLWEKLADDRRRSRHHKLGQDPHYVAFAERLAAGVPNGRAAVVPGAGHAVHLERPAAFAALLEAHLSSR